MAENKSTRRILMGKLNERDRVEELDVDGRTGWGCVDRIHLALTREKWGTFMKTAMKLRVPPPPPPTKYEVFFFVGGGVCSGGGA